MDLEQLSGRYRRLKDELSAVYVQQPWPDGRIDRLAQEIAQTEQAIAALDAKPATRASDGRTATTRTATIARHRLTPFGQRICEPAAK